METALHRQLKEIYADGESQLEAPLDKFRVLDKEPARLNIDDLFFRSIDLPHFNKVTQAIEGISLLPIESKRYREALER